MVAPPVVGVQMDRMRGCAYGEAFRSSITILGVDGTEAQVQKGSPAAGKVRLESGTRVIPTPAEQGILLGKTFVGYVDARSGRQFVISIMVRDVPISSAQDIFPMLETVTEDQGALAAEIQQGYRADGRRILLVVECVFSEVRKRFISPR